MTKAKPMNSAKAQRLKARGWKSGTVSEFLDLTDAEAQLVGWKLALSDRYGNHDSARASPR